MRFHVQHQWANTFPVRWLVDTPNHLYEAIYRHFLEGPGMCSFIF